MGTLPPQSPWVNTTDRIRSSRQDRKSPVPGVSLREVREFNLVMAGYAFFQALACACALDLFTLLSRGAPRTLADIARKLRVSRYGARVLLLGLAAAGLVLRDARGTYRNSRIAQRLLVRSSPHNVLSAVTAYHELIYRPMFHLKEAVQSGVNVGLQVFPGRGNTLYQRLARRPRLERVFQDWLEVVSARSNPVLAGVAQLKKVTHLLDVGGGNGTNAIALRMAFPQMKITVFDLPSVCKLARANIRRHGLENDIDLLPGDFFKDRFPPGVDGILFGHILNIFGEDKNRELLRRSHEALAPGGIAICYNSMTEDDESGPPRSAMSSLYFLTLASGEGIVYPWKDYQRWYRETGFRTVRVYRVGDLMDHGIVVGAK
jgi:predicted O-methyltransferase YrrM